MAGRHCIACESSNNKIEINGLPCNWSAKHPSEHVGVNQLGITKLPVQFLSDARN